MQRFSSEALESLDCRLGQHFNAPVEMALKELTLYRFYCLKIAKRGFSLRNSSLISKLLSLHAAGNS